MAQQIINTDGTSKDYDERTGTSTARKLLGELVVGIRVDTLPAGDAERLADEGKFYPLTTDANGNLRVVPPDWIKVQIQSLEVLSDMRTLLAECRDLLREIA